MSLLEPVYPIVRPLVAMPADWEARIAFSSPAGSLSFRELRDDMLAFAGWLVREAGVKPGDRVALCLPKTIEAVIALYGILAAGAAYVGLQHRGPVARLAAIIESTAPRLVLTTPEMSRQLEAAGLASLPPVLHIDSVETGRGLEPILRSTAPLADTVPVDADGIAAIVFTSGSTGEPKGVIRSHRAMVANGNWHVESDAITPADARIGNVALHYLAPNLHFPAAAGCRVHLVPDETVMFPEAVAEILERERITMWSSTATALRLLIERGDIANRKLAALRMVKSHGEVLPIEVLRAALAAFPQSRVLTGYGSTEAPNITSYEAFRPFPADMPAVPLGRLQTDYYRMWLVDEDGRPVPPGEVGEICAEGGSVTLGYWNDPVLTAEKRIGGRPYTYRTGDLGRLDADGVLHFVGRMDHMVKLRGNRFDLNEIEAALRRHPAVRAAAAYTVRRSDGETEVAAAVEAHERADLEAQIMRVCSERLPRFAWPARIRILPELPRLPNGKIDRVRLAAADRAATSPVPAG
jgi:amino acid adenylation domain-containing protein